MDQLGQENMEFIIEPIGSKEHTIALPSERPRKPRHLSVVTEFIQLIADQSNVEAGMGLVVSRREWILGQHGIARSVIGRRTDR